MIKRLSVPMTPSILKQFILAKANGLKSFAVLVDPDKTETDSCFRIINECVTNKVDFLFVGGSLIMGNNMGQVVRQIKSQSSIPVILFPGSNLHIDTSADAIFFLSLISGRNPDLLIGQHVIAAPTLKKSRLEILPTGYMLIESGRQTTVSYISNTTPIPHDKPEIAACTAMAGEMLGLKLIYLDGGSGARKQVSPEMIAAVRRSIDVPLIVGGGIRSAQEATEAFEAGADVVVIGNGIEKNPSLLAEVSEKTHLFNTKKALNNF